LSLALLISGLLSPKIAKIINANNFVLLYSGIAMGIGLIVLGLAQQYWTFLIGWVIIGVSMGMGLYDSLYATLGKKYGKEASKSIIQITLISGFAPTISWSFVSLLLHNFGWRNACFIYAIVLLIAIFPIHQFAFGLEENNDMEVLQTKNKKTVSSEIFRSTLFYLLLSNFTTGAILMTGIGVYLIDILINKQIETSKAIGIAALLGPSQVGVRFLDLILPKKTPVKTAAISAIVILLGFLLLLFDPKFAFLGVIIFGLGNGMRTILRGTLPLSIFGQENYVFIIGKLARLPLIAQAATPFVGGFLIQQFGVLVFLYTLCALAFINISLILTIQKIISKQNGTCVQFANVSNKNSINHKKQKNELEI
jgi:hypothetical protein